ncbi:MAG: dihydrofolate reductase family protein [Pirellulales bacterium]|nr:dihydrofolate reductase family protein [Pirellulales bacterium]
MKTIYYVATSLDGFIADAEGGVEWLDRVGIEQDMSGYEAFFASVDGLLMGRKTYDFVYDYGQWPYEDKPAWVCSSREVPRMDGCNLQSEHAPEAVIEQARRQGVTALWVVGGGQLASALIKAGQLTHLSISLMPVLLGRGIPLVDLLPNHLYLRQVNSTPMSGYTQIEYRIEG